ncbi:hypothetical protein SGPA1_10713 [Streptomyces misionensis JCM 4497]
MRPARLGADREGRQPADRRREHPGVRRGRGLPGEVRRGPRGRARRAQRRPRGLHRAHTEEGQLPGPRLQAGLPDRPAPQGHGHRHRRGPQRGRGPAGRRGGRPAGRVAARPGRRRPGPLGAAAGRGAAVRRAGLTALRGPALKTSGPRRRRHLSRRAHAAPRPGPELNKLLTPCSPHS